MHRPDVFASDLPYGPWKSRASDVWRTFVAAESGDVAALRRLLERDRNLGRSEYWYTSPLRLAVREGHVEAAKILLEAGGEPPDPLGREDLLTLASDRGHSEVARLLEDFRVRGEPEATGGEPHFPESPTARLTAALHAAAGAGDRSLVEALLAQGGDPNAHVDSSGSATYAAKTPEIRALLVAHGGRLDPFDLVFLNEDDEALKRVVADPASADSGCGGVLAAACTLGKRDLLVRLLEAGVRVPRVLTACRSYLLADPEMLRLLLASGMNPDLPNWQSQTPLHDLCGRDGRGRPRPRREECSGILLDRGAGISVRDDDYRSTPLAWAARSDLPDMVDFLLARGAATNLPDDQPWATPLAWATRRKHVQVAAILRRAGART